MSDHPGSDPRLAPFFLYTLHRADGFQNLIELMPNEVESIVIPYSEHNERLLETIDGKLRNKESIHDILKFTDEVILKELFNFSDKEIFLANSIWKKLSNRRLNRGR